MPYHHRIIVYFDGASKSNPHGPAGCGWIMYEMDCYGADGNFIARGRRYLGYNVSNNQAEYRALDAALDYMYDNGISCDGLYIRGDSEIVIKQLEGTYQVRSSNIIPDYNQVKYSLGYVDHSFVRFTHIDRYRNSEADELANDAIENENSYISD
mmetsp:Transcript_7431/g.18614  ORF Transcript_7431/g.18614 Transcript_7431/m.18614 type:complete len:154 (+) Transcript_7431:201-662(+)|eukprot:CAMPEP_0172397960 /NCGR_PEP_ID=MMETSP1061-20121228/33481_1 /TAXON_ID=37318 /ORGANISM="Pseudo-nitzschia pungens, Strain cf. pungens" /LENGTH=153 /DNA_ID=CAMNT_0013130299 /DNA_START=187 /DNA_END=648 /DNA_ORIENTATION=-